MEVIDVHADIMDMQAWTPLYTFAASFVCSALSAFAALLWSPEPMGLRNLTRYPCYFGFGALMFSAIMYDLPGFPANKPWRLMGISIGIGLSVFSMDWIGKVLRGAIQSLVKGFVQTGDDK